jgi:formylglycine-generating enzyme required for sulfatase activity
VHLILAVAALLGSTLPLPGSARQVLPDPPGAPAPHDPRDHGQEWVSVPVGGLMREVEVELYGTTRTAAPGVKVTLPIPFLRDRGAGQTAVSHAL